MDPASRPSGRDSLLVRASAPRAARWRRSSAAHEAALAAEDEVAARLAVAQEQFQRHRAALTTLTSRNAALLGPAIAARDAYEDTLAAEPRARRTSVNGMQAAPAALAAVGFALRQLGKPYEWAAEGPNAYDCSGLVLASYQSVGVKPPARLPVPVPRRHARPGQPAPPR